MAGGKFFQLAGVALLIGAGFHMEAIASASSLTPASATVLSNEGSGRATAYLEQNKIVTLGGKTHVAWQDGGAKGFRVFVRTLDRRTGIWSPAVLIGPAQDNHGGPSLTVDSQGYLHIVYYPHHGACHYRRSVRPNDASEWTPETQFGEGLTYPAMVCGADDTLYVAARRVVREPKNPDDKTDRMDLELWKKPAAAAWQCVGTLIRSRALGYSQYGASLAWGPDHRTLHLGCRVYEGNPFVGGYQAYTAGYMKSVDGGATWTKADGSPITLPATADTIDVIARDGGEAGPMIHSGAIAVDASGVPHLLYSSFFKDASRLYLATPAPCLGWTRRDLTPYLPAGWENATSFLNMAGGITFSDTGRATLVAVLYKLAPGEKADPVKQWGNPATEIVRLWSDDGLKQFKSEILQPEDPQEAHWLPNLERATGFNSVPANPGILFTAGAPGGHVSDLEITTKVIWHTGN